ncbi:unnamed protein product [Didymodactylos carnosus]|uniref:Uncharacterized protein n=1 Tax=Didymodactylos carnosus TaxID=1234261 RepID=A0A8S2FZN6_9BILA|nr:unnamed protein product [Didymodactylos carnosus]CAF4370404.1 unnamed protein product [Didymodactylos carnosus]
MTDTLTSQISSVNTIETLILETDSNRLTASNKKTLIIILKLQEKNMENLQNALDEIGGITLIYNDSVKKCCTDITINMDKQIFLLILGILDVDSMLSLTTFPQLKAVYMYVDETIKTDTSNEKFRGIFTSENDLLFELIRNMIYVQTQEGHKLKSYGKNILAKTKYQQAQELCKLLRKALAMGWTE